jgi:hypothetical protein
MPSGPARARRSFSNYVCKCSVNSGSHCRILFREYAAHLSAMFPAITGPINKPRKYDVLQQKSVEASMGIGFADLQVDAHPEPSLM